MLLMDEIQHLLSCGLRDQRAALNAIKFLANKLRISIVAAGTHEALHVMRRTSDCEPLRAAHVARLDGIPGVTSIHSGLPSTAAD
jgi:hypothetical protein